MVKPPEQPEALEEELRVIWLNAGNTRKRTAQRRIETIIESSRAELSLRDLLIFFTYLGQAFFMLLFTVLQALFHAPRQPKPARGSKK